MREEIYRWMKSLAVFYLFFTAVLQLVPDRKYERYVRSFMGLLLIYMLCTPVFAAFGKSGQFLESFADTFYREQEKMEQLEAEELQTFYLKQGYENEISFKIEELLKESGINPSKTAVHIEGERIFAVLTVRQELTREQERGIRDELRKRFGIEEKDCKILTDRNDGTTVDGPSASGNASDSDRASDIRQ